MRFLAPVLMACLAAAAGLAGAAAGRNWQVSIDGIACEAAASRIVLEARVRYTGPRGLVEAPVNQLVDGDGEQHSPRGLVWQGGSKALAAWLSAGGLRNLQAEEAAKLQFKFEVREGTETLALEFGDLKPLALTRKRGAGPRGLCDALLKPGQIQAAGAPRSTRADAPVPAFRVYRSVYPCRPPSRGPVQTIEAQYPPELPELLVVMGRGYLPNIRQVALPMGKADAQSYLYAGAEELADVENAARRALANDFPGYAASLGGKHYAYNWGTQTAASGNRIYSIGIYALRACPK